MPQMSPMLWILLFLLFSCLIFFTSLKLFYGNGTFFLSKNENKMTMLKENFKTWQW